MSALESAAYRASLIVVDIDGTLADFSHRLHKLSEHDNPNCLAEWPEQKIAEFMAPELVAMDTWIRPGVDFLRRWSECREFRFLTGRWETLRAVTVDWLAYAGWKGPIVGDMRTMFETSKKSVVVKERHLRNYPPGTIVLDDDPLVIELSQSLGLQAFLAPSCFG